jgi:hypothetical protein
MNRYKRNQVEEAIAAAMERTDENAFSELRVRIKRLLDADRGQGRDPGASAPEHSAYAFYSAEAPGSGVEVWFSPYEAFALLVALLLLQHGWPQGAVVRIMRRLRPSLEPEHNRILSQDREQLFDLGEVSGQAAPGMIAVDNTDPVFIAIISGSGAEKGQADGETSPKAVGTCRGQVELMKLMLQEAGTSTTVLEIVGQAHLLASRLANTKPRARGRSGR